MQGGFDVIVKEAYFVMIFLYKIIVLVLKECKKDRLKGASHEK